MIYFQNLDAGSLSPLNHWLLQVYESDTYSDLDELDVNDYYINYPVESPALNGSYSIGLNVTHTYYRLTIS